MSSQPLAARAKTLDIFTAITDDLRHVESAIEQALETDEEMLAEVSTYLLKAGGKRVRPALVLLTSKFPGADMQQAIPAAVAVELIHMATLVHDDVVDNATLRRGIPTINAKWSNHVSVLTGDYLFAKAFSILAHTGCTRMVQLMADVVHEMSRGEMAQSASCFKADQTEADYYRRIAQKTGYLLAECCRLGGIAAGADEPQVQALYDFGLSLGLSFQIVDDLLDFQGSSAAVGKPVCSDLKAGIITLPVIHGLGCAERMVDLRERIATRALTDADVADITAILEESGSFSYARHMAYMYLDRALQALNQVSDLATCLELHNLANFVISRQF